MAVFIRPVLHALTKQQSDSLGDESRAKRIQARAIGQRAGEPCALLRVDPQAGLQEQRFAALQPIHTLEGRQNAVVGFVEAREDIRVGRADALQRGRLESRVVDGSLQCPPESCVRQEGRVLFAREVAEHGALGEVRRLGDVFDTRGLYSTIFEQGERRGADRLLRNLALALPK